MKKRNPCPICGERNNIYRCKSAMHKLKSWFFSCGYCRFHSKKAFTRWGARRKWNKATNVVDVWDWR